LYYDVEITPEEEEQLIEQVAKKINEYGMDTAAILLLESSKPLVWVGGEMGRFFITPFIPIVSEKWGVKSEKFFLIFEKRSNIERLLKRVETLAIETDMKKKEENKKSGSSEVDKPASSEINVPTATLSVEGETPKKEEKKGWRRYLPF
jgi:hypothetical protein